jgi:hypothetical protein
VILALSGYVEHVFVCQLQSSIRVLREIQIEINELNTLTPTYTTVKYGIKSENKKKALSVADTLYINKKVNTQPHPTRIKLVEKLGIRVLSLNNITANKNNIPQHGGSSKSSRTNNS